jgi:hypothetical protein
MSSQAQKRAARQWYAQFADIDTKQKAQRSRRWAPELAEQLTWAPAHQRESIACLLLSLFNASPDKLFPNALEMKNLLFLANHEIKKLAMLAEHHSDILIDWADRLEAYKVFAATEKKKATSEEPEEVEVEAPVDEKGKKKKAAKATFDRHATSGEMRALKASIAKELTSNIPGDIALFGRMMAGLYETSVDGSVQVAHAISVNTLPKSKTFDNKWRIGELDFFSAKDDRIQVESDAGAAMIDEVSFSAPVYYRYANVCIDEMLSLMGDADLAKKSIAAFLQGFVRSLPEGMKRSFAHGSLPEFVLCEVIEGCPYQLSSAFSSPIDRPDIETPSNHGGVSISRQAVKALMTRRDEMHKLYGNQTKASAVTAVADHWSDVLPLDETISQTLSSCF